MSLFENCLKTLQLSCYLFNSFVCFVAVFFFFFTIHDFSHHLLSHLSHRTPINYLLVNLAISDITFAVFVAPNHILKKLFIHPDGAIGSNICKFLTSGNMAWVGAASSSVTLVVIAVERYYTVMCPIGNTRKLNKRTVKVRKHETAVYYLLRSP